MYHMVHVPSGTTKEATVGQQHIRVDRKTAADAATVFRLLVDGVTWPTWSPLGSFELERAGNPPAGADRGEGVGAIRIFRTRRVTGEVINREEVVEAVPNRRFSYILLSGLPLRDYRADIDLEPVDGGTTIHWH